MWWNLHSVSYLTWRYKMEINHDNPSRKSRVVGKIISLPVRLLSWLASLVWTLTHDFASLVGLNHYRNDGLPAWPACWQLTALQIKLDFSSGYWKQNFKQTFLRIWWLFQSATHFMRSDNLANVSYFHSFFPTAAIISINSSVSE